MDDLLGSANNLDLSDKGRVEMFRDLVLREGGQVLATLEGLREEIQDLKSEGDRIRSSEVSLQDLEDKFQKHFNGLTR